MSARESNIRRYIPNALTWLRLALAAVFPFVGPDLRLWVFGGAALTEFIDGFLARRWNVVSQFGRTLDPIADKLFVLSVVGTFLWEGWVELWEVALIGIRDAVSVLGAGYVGFRHGRERFEGLKPRWLGKITTNLQFLFLLVVLFEHDAPLWLVAVTAALSTAAALDYIRSAANSEA